MNLNKKVVYPFKVSARLICSFLVLISILFYANPVSAQYQNTQKAVKATINSFVKGYYESLPVDYASNPTKKYPLLLFIHGKGEIGNGTTGLSLVLRNGPPKLLNQGKFPSSFTVGGKSHSFIVISPQFTEANYTEASLIINDIIDYCKRTYRIDEQRVYLTGLSMGGLMVWNYIGKSSEYASNIAAELTVCGGISNTPTKIKNVAGSALPVWATINSGDPIFSPSSTSEAIASLNAYVPTPPKSLLSIFPASGHDAWTKSYDPNFKLDGLNVYEWMLSYKKESVATVNVKSNAGANQTITQPVNSGILDGSSKSVFPTGSTFLWTKISGPSGSKILKPTSLITEIRDLNSIGDYYYELTITDKSGYSSVSGTHVIVKAGSGTNNPAPVANAGANQTIMLPTNSATLDGSAKSTYSAGSTFSWVKLTGPSGSKILEPSSLKTEITDLNIAGDYLYQLTITDKSGNKSVSEVHIIVQPKSSIVLEAKAGSNQTLVQPENSSILNGSGSTYPAGSTFSWVKLTGPSGSKILEPSSLKTEITDLNIAGDYHYRLTITNEGGNTSVSEVHVTVQPKSSIVLEAKAGSNQTLVQPENSSILNGSGSSYPAGSTFSWIKLTGPSGSKILEPSSLKTGITDLNVAGDYHYRLKITDKAGNTSVSEVHVIVNSKSAQPRVITLLADAGSEQSMTLPSNSSTLDGSGSTYPEGSTFSWIKLTGPSGSKILEPTSLIAEIRDLNIAGDYHYQLTITDNEGNTSNSTIHVIVNPYPLSIFNANAGSNQTLFQPEKSSTLNGTASTYPAGSTFSWIKLTGPSGSKILEPSSLKTGITDLNVAGDYHYRLTITDEIGNTSVSEVHVVVKSQASVPMKANAGSEQTIVLPENSSTLDGAGSTYPAGSLFLWIKLTGPSGSKILNPTSLKTGITDLNIPGNYRYQLTITDKEGNQSMGLTNVVVQQAEIPLSARTSASNNNTKNLNNSAGREMLNSELNSSEVLGLRVFPNPVQSDLRLTLNSRATGKVSIKLYNTQGQSMLQHDFLKPGTGVVYKSVNISKLPSGIYVLQAIIEGKYKQTIRVVKQ